MCLLKRSSGTWRQRVLDADLEHLHELVVDGVGGGQVGHDQVGVGVEGKQSLKALVLLLGRFVDALDGGAAGDEVV